LRTPKKLKITRPQRVSNRGQRHGKWILLLNYYVNIFNTFLQHLAVQCDLLKSLRLLSAVQPQLARFLASSRLFFIVQFCFCCLLIFIFILHIYPFTLNPLPFTLYPLPSTRYPRFSPAAGHYPSSKQI
jgi:hypothetical protein